MSDPLDPSDDALERALRSSRTMEEPPQAVLDRAMALFSATPAASADGSWAGGVRAGLARLLSDTGFVPTLALGVRSASEGVRCLLYSAGDRDIDLRVSPNGGAGARWRIEGQVLGPEWKARVSLHDPQGRERAAVQLGEQGEFRFPAVEAGRWSLRLLADEVRVELPPLDLSAP